MNITLLLEMAAEAAPDRIGLVCDGKRWSYGELLSSARGAVELIEASGVFALQLPTRAMATLTVGVGSDSGRDVPDKLARHGVKTFTAPGSELPLVEGCVGWLVCRLVPEPHNQQAYDLFIGEAGRGVP